MPRRPRPASRPPPKSVRQGPKNTLDLEARRDVRSGSIDVDRNQERSDLELQEIGFSDSDRETESDGGREQDWEDVEDAADPDAPRTAQWIDEDAIDVSSNEDEDGSAENAGPGHITKIQNDLSNLPLGALRKAQHALYQTEVDSDGESADESDRSNDTRGSTQNRGKEKVEWSLKPKSAIPKRGNKHAPIEISSKRPVTRRRQVVEVKTSQPRDPRFLPLTGQFSAEKFQNDYSFLVEARKNDLSTLKGNLKKSRKMLSSAPRDRRTEWENEVKRLELAVKRTESLVNKDRQDKIQMEALQGVRKEEREKQKQGKGGWWMKKAEEKKVVVEARYRSLEEEGGKRAVKKAIEKKQKKMGQQEKRKRPLVRETDFEGRKRQRIK